MHQNHTVLLVGDIVDDSDGTVERSWFDEDKPSRGEVADLVSWLTRAGYCVEVQGDIRDFVDSGPQHDNVIVFPLWRGGRSRNRTAIVPAVCEARGLLYVGGDAFVQTVCQDKSLSKALAQATGLAVPGEWLLRSDGDLNSFRPSWRLRAPYVVKPLYSAASIGVTDESLCRSDETARLRAENLFDAGLGPVVCEEFIEGDEVSLCFIEERGRILEKCVVTYRDASGRCPFYNRLFTFDDKMNTAPPWDIALWPEPLSERIWQLAEAVTRMLGKVDYMRIDGRMQADRLVLIEFTPDIHMGLTSSFLGGFSAAGSPPHILLDGLIQASLRNQAA
jgi:D-alanine-D-alanine ligase